MSEEYDEIALGFETSVWLRSGWFQQLQCSFWHAPAYSPGCASFRRDASHGTAL
jgi:hypothetical protein